MLDRVRGSVVSLAVLAACLSGMPGTAAYAADLPAIKASAKNSVPACVTPGRLQAYLLSRNPSLSKQFDAIAVEYMKHGEALGLRWDYAFYQMIVETGALSYKNGSRQGDVREKQYNFAGLGATGNGERGETFPDMTTGVKAHLQHVQMYSGEKVEHPVGERTRKVQEWGVLTSWQKGFKRPITFSDLGQKWAPGTRSYAAQLESVSDKFNQEHCDKPDPKPELLAMARGGVTAVAEAKSPTADVPAAEALTEKISGRDLARRAQKDGVDKKFALGAAGLAKSVTPQVKIINQAPEPAEAVETSPAAPTAPTATKTALAGGGAKAAAPAMKPQVPAAEAATPAPAGKCRVFTASYGGQKAVIVRSLVDKIVSFTVLDVNEGQEKREADAFISAYAKGGAIAGEFATQTQALDKAFELCPEG
ncbi:MAG: glucosaminidase domain-containing protein [Hyphomicrobiaceae bacterium]|nr:glucosaminidase domain-containing protein [Hyphomicrobiaceae bacterium]